MTSRIVRIAFVLLIAGVIALPMGSALAQDDAVTLIIESWRVDDADEWNDVILPAFEAHYPNINVDFQPTINTQYGATLGTKIEAGTAGDLIMVEPFDYRLEMYLNGDLANLGDLGSLENYSAGALSAWSTDDGELFGVPLAAVIHGFMYNADIFAELGLEEPATAQEFLDLLEAVKQDGQYVPLAMGTSDGFVPGLLGLQLAGQPFWRGEEGRLALIDGSGKFTDQGYIDAWAFLAAWADYMPDGYQAVSYPDMQNLFTLGGSAVYPAGSWEISIFNQLVGDDFAIGAFPPPVPEDGADCFINDHMDMGMAMNADTQHPEEAQLFLEWLGSAEFAELWNNALPGFFAMSNHMVEATDPMVQTYAGWRANCDSSPRNAYAIISRGEPNTDSELIRVTQLVMNGEMSPEEAGETVQAGLASWYEPQMGE